MIVMTEAKAKEVHKAMDLAGFTREELQAADLFVEHYALDQLEKNLHKNHVDPRIIQFIALMARCHYGSVEVDDFLMGYQCYPEWLTDE